MDPKLTYILSANEMFNDNRSLMSFFSEVWLKYVVFIVLLQYLFIYLFVKIYIIQNFSHNNFILTFF